jgi:hypothetical protein
VLGSRVLGPVPYDSPAAGVLAGRRRTRSGISRSKLGRTATGMAGYLAVTVPATSAAPALGAAPAAGYDPRAALPPTRTGAR